MTAKEFLSAYQNTERRIKAKISKIEEYKSTAKYISINFGDKVQTSKQIHGTEKIICMYMDMQKEIEADVLGLRENLKAIKKTINSLSDSCEKEILERKYMNGESFSQISNVIFLSERQIIRIHGKALEKIQKIIDKQV